MNLGPCTFTNCDNDADAAHLAQGLAWNPPNGHAEWCFTQRTPWERGSRGSEFYGWTLAPKPSRTCNCSKNALAKHLRKLVSLGVLRLTPDNEMQAAA